MSKTRSKFEGQLRELNSEISVLSDKLQAPASALGPSTVHQQPAVQDGAGAGHHSNKGGRAANSSLVDASKRASGISSEVNNGGGEKMELRRVRAELADTKAAKEASSEAI